MTLNGKIDVKSLPEATIYRGKSTAKAAVKVEEDFCRIFGDILQIEEVGADESFFDLGGTSLLVTRVVILGQKAGYKLSFSDVFKCKTPRALAALQNPAAEENIDSEISNYDYSKLQAILQGNNLDNFHAGRREPLADIILTGATGYLGVHILHEFIENHSGKVYCLLRSKKKISAESRLKTQLFYYFENTYEELFGKRIFVLEGDITRPDTLKQCENLSADTVVNCAALVKHFDTGSLIESVNVSGVKNLIDLCAEHGKKLIQISTISTVRTMLKSNTHGRTTATEQDLYFNQLLTNKYVHAKFLAERAILDAVANRGLNAKIMRVGNLAPRFKDGEFQINVGTNSSMGRLKMRA